VVLIALALGLGLPLSARGQEADPPLTSPATPYRGRVVELLTGRPLADAWILFAWQRLTPDGSGAWVTYAIREALTDATGGFVVEAADIEAAPPAGARAPRMFVYRPGYTPVPPEHGARFGIPAAWLRDRGGALALKPVRDLEERSEAFNLFQAAPTRLLEDPAGIRLPPDLGAYQRILREELGHLMQVLERAPTAKAAPPPTAAPRGRVATAGSAREHEYLDGPRGPYRGRVIDTETKAPLAGAVVVAVWRRLQILPLRYAKVWHAVRELLTDADGRFVLDGRDVEDDVAHRIYPPEFTIFLPGYGFFPRYQAAPRGYIGEIFEGPGTTVELQALRTPEERRDRLRSIAPELMSEQPFRDVPHLMKAIDRERITIGLSPLIRERTP
jgi:hypothetical protein